MLHQNPRYKDVVVQVLHCEPLGEAGLSRHGAIPAVADRKEARAASEGAGWKSDRQHYCLSCLPGA